MKSLKIFGWILLILGLAIIFYSLFNSYNIFTDKSLPPVVFKVEEKKDDNLTQKEKTLIVDEDIASSSPFANARVPEEVEKLMEEKLKEQLETIIPSNTLPKLFNLISWSILAGILIFGGAQIASLGINLIKK